MQPGMSFAVMSLPSGAVRRSLWRDHPWLLTGTAFRSILRRGLERSTVARKRWKYRMQETGCKLPTQMPELRSRCYCGAAIDSATMDGHIFTAHLVA